MGFGRGAAFSWQGGLPALRGVILTGLFNWVIFNPWGQHGPMPSSTPRALQLSKQKDQN